MDEDFEPLVGGNMGKVLRDGGRVVRQAGAWTAAVHRLLDHLDAAGIRGLPRPLGLTDDGREVLTFVEGTVPAYPMPGWVWAETALSSAARLLRQVHDATAGVVLEGSWRSPTHQPVEVVCHNDFAPYNLVFDGAAVVGAIDWDFASPGPRLWDLAYLAYRIVPLSTADWGDGFPAAERRERLRRLLEAYGTEAPAAEVVDVLRRRLVELAELSDRLARELGRPQLAGDARLYRRDAAYLRDQVH